MCNHSDCVDTDYSIICLDCGVERRILKIVAGYSENSPLWIGYSRVGRFRKILVVVSQTLRFNTLKNPLRTVTRKREVCNNPGFNWGDQTI